MKRLLFAVLFVFAPALANADTPTVVIPASPVVGQEFVIHFEGNLLDGCGTEPMVQAQVVGNAITLNMPVTLCGATTIALPNPRSAVGKVTAPGAYGLDATFTRNGTVIARRSLGSFTVRPAPQVVRAAPRLDGLWNVPDRPGWGVRITEGESGQLFIVWYTYESGTSRWYVSSNGLWTGANEYSGAFFRVNGPGMGDYPAFDWAKGVRTPLGIMTVTSTGSDELVFKTTAPGLDYQWTLRRLVF